MTDLQGPGWEISHPGPFHTSDTETLHILPQDPASLFLRFAFEHMPAAVDLLVSAVRIDLLQPPGVTDIHDFVRCAVNQ